MKQQFTALIQSWPRTTWTKRAKNNQSLLQLLDELYPGVPDLSIKIRCLMYDESPYCVVCGAPVKHIRKKTCSVKCRTESLKTFQAERVRKQKETMMAKYGVDNIGKLPATTEKRKTTMMQKYGGMVSEKSRNKH